MAGFLGRSHGYAFRRAFEVESEFKVSRMRGYTCLCVRVCVVCVMEGM